MDGLIEEGGLMENGSYKHRGVGVTLAIGGGLRGGGFEV